MLRRSSRVGAAALRRLTAADTTRVQSRAMGFFSNMKDQLKAEMDKNEELKKSFEEIEKTKEQLKNVEKAAMEKMKEVSSMTEEAAKTFSEQATAASQKLKDSYTASRGAEASAAEDATDGDEKNDEKKSEESDSDEEKEEKEEEKRESEEGGVAASVKDFFSKINAQRQTLIKPQWKEEWRSAAKELFGGSEVSSVDEALASVHTPSAKKAKSSEDGEAAEYAGPSALVAVKEEESAWQKVSARFREAPIIQGILDAAKQAARTDAGKKASETAKMAKNKISDATEDVREIWETSQNPWVYRLSSLYDGFFGETPMAIAIKEIRRAEPDFILEAWKDKIETIVLPGVLEAFLRGNSRDLKKWFGEAAYSRINMAIRERKTEGLVMDPNILSIDHVDVIEATAEDKQAPIILVRFQAQQINCIRNREGEIVDGAEDEVLAYYYIFAFQRDYDDEQEALRWRIVELQMQRGGRYY